MNKNSIGLLSVTIVASLMTSVQAQVEWGRMNPSQEGINAARVLGDEGLYICRGTYAEKPGGKLRWRDIGVVTKKGLCRTLRVNKKRTMQEDFYVLIAEPKGDMDESAKLFTDIIGESATLAADLADWTEVWGGIAEEIEGNYGDFAEDFEFTEYTESELDLELPEREFAVNSETLSAISRDI